MSARVGGTVLLALVAGAAPVAAQRTAARDTACSTILRDRTVSAVGSRPCQTLAVFLIDSLTESEIAPLRQGQIPARELQSTRALGPNLGGSPAQGEAVPSANPVALAAASISAVGSDAGSDAIAAISVNPALFVMNPRNKEEVARLTRLTDLTLLVPVEGLDDDEDGEIDYFGARLRLNMTGPSSGSQLMREAERIFRTIVGGHRTLALELADVLETVEDPGACVQALLESSARPETIIDSCERPLWVQASPTRYEELSRLLSQAREEADSRYLGLDLRLDFGDPTLGAVRNASGTFITAGLAAGRQLAFGGDQLSSTGLKARVGLRYATLRDTSAHELSVEGGLGFEMRRPFESQQVTASAGLEFRYGDEHELAAPLQTDFLMFRATLAVPVSAGQGVSINFGAPLSGPPGTVLSVALNTGLLLPRL